MIFINDFFDLPIQSSPFRFTDDKSSAIFADNIEDLAGVVSEYFHINKLTLNLSKTKLVLFRKPHVIIISYLVVYPFSVAYT